MTKLNTFEEKHMPRGWLEFEIFTLYLVDEDSLRYLVRGDILGEEGDGKGTWGWSTHSRHTITCTKPHNSARIGYKRSHWTVETGTCNWIEEKTKEKTTWKSQPGQLYDEEEEEEGSMQNGFIGGEVFWAQRELGEC